LIPVVPTPGLVGHLVVKIGPKFGQGDLTVTIAIVLSIRLAIQGFQKVLGEQTMLGG
jgi:hypothetical protein